MRYYLSGPDEEYVLDLTRSIKHSSELVEFHFSTMDEKRTGHLNKRRLFVRRLAGQYFCSFDGTRWEKLARQEIPTKILNTNRVLDLSRGYKPSGLAGGGEEGPVTQMPGKVVKIAVKVGEAVKKGQTLIILEAMKMENEIKSAHDGTVKAVLVKEGDILEQGVLMMEVAKEGA